MSNQVVFEGTLNPQTINHVLTITDSDQERIYTDVIPLNGTNGYVEIIDNLYGGSYRFAPNPNSRYKSISIKRHASNTVIIEARLDNQTALIVDPSYPGSQHSSRRGYADYGWAWKPWNTDAINSYEDNFKFTRQDRLRGGNRLKIDLYEPSAFTITIPADCDIKIDTKQTPIVAYLTPAFKSKDQPIATSTDSNEDLVVPTKLSVDAESVNMCGNSGVGGRWDYFWGTHKNPVTHIVAQGAQVFLPTKNMHISTHHQFWMSHCTSAEDVFHN